MPCLLMPFFRLHWPLPEQLLLKHLENPMSKIRRFYTPVYCFLFHIYVVPFSIRYITFAGELCDESSVGEDDPVAEPPCPPPSVDPSLLDLESAIFLGITLIFSGLSITPEQIIQLVMRNHSRLLYQ